MKQEKSDTTGANPASTPLHCPFCGEKAWIRTKPFSLDGIARGFTVECETDECFGYASYPFSTKSVAIERWNRRAPLIPALTLGASPVPRANHDSTDAGLPPKAKSGLFVTNTEEESKNLGDKDNV